MFAKEDSNLFQSGYATADHAGATIVTFCAAQALFKVADCVCTRSAPPVSSQMDERKTAASANPSRRSSPYSSANTAAYLTHDHQYAATHMPGTLGQQGLYCASGKLEL